MIETPIQRAAVGPVEKIEGWILPLVDFPLEEKAAQNRRDEQSKYQRTEQGESYGPRHGAEQAAFDALQGEDRKVGNNDNDARKKHRLLHFVRGHRDRLHERLLPAESGVTEDVFDHYNRTVNDHAEVERTQRKQVGGDLPQVEQDGSE